jgi:hypothetical protein
MADPKAQTPTPDELIGKGIDALVALRPRALRHINAGRGGYANIFAGWRAQAALLCRRQADFAKNGRVPFSEGDQLLFLAGSEFDTPAELVATRAVGQVVLTRDAGRPGGAIRKGARFTRSGDTSSERLWSAAQCEAAGDVYVPQGATQVEVPLVAAREGSFANRPRTSALATELEIADEIVDRAAWTVQSYELGGGSDGVTDADLQRYSRAFASGQHGPNERAAIAGVLKAGAKHALAVDDVSLAALVVYVADQSWAGSARWARILRQRLSEQKFIGFGCKVLVQLITNELVGIEANCKVRLPEYLEETTTLDAAIQKAVRSYFDDRPDFNKWRAGALRGVIARADRRLLTCSSVTMKRLDGTVLSEPTTTTGTHYRLVDNAVRVTYASPS